MPSQSRLHRHVVRLICGVLAIGLLIPAMVVGANLWVFRTARPHMYVDSLQVPSRPVAIVPGSMVIDGVPTAYLRQRLVTALALYKAGKVRAILVSGNRRDAGYDETTAMSRWLVDNGAPEADVVADPAGFRTLDTMQRAARVYGVKDAIICSQGVHLARAVFLARQEGINAVGLATDPKRPIRTMAIPHETLGSALAALEIVLGRHVRVMGPAQPIDQPIAQPILGDTRTTAALVAPRRGPVSP